ncbi:MAG: hypothetical protein HYU36_00245, partial [Planctomycetes bacterium]|nr:hypothetical protein [Planctomycetota bacterium]
EDPYGKRAGPTKIPAGRIELDFPAPVQFLGASLDIRDAVATVRLSPNVHLRLIAHARLPLGILCVIGQAPSALRLIPPAFGGSDNDLARLGYPPPECVEGERWKAYRQHGVEGFHFAVYVAWTAREGRWEAAWSVSSSFETHEPLWTARKRVERGLQSGFDRALQPHAHWWREYWRKSSLSIPQKTIERQWFLDQYKFGAASRRGSPPITLQGPWTADNGKIPPWKGDYHHDLNTQLSYWPCYSANHLEEGLSFLDWLWNTRHHARDWTWRFFRLPGLNVPMTADLHNRQMGGWRQYTHSATTAAWLAHHFDLHWRYSGDRRFLRNRAFPYLRDAALFLEAVTASRDAEGKRTLPVSASPEIHDNRPEAWFDTLTNFDLALIRWLFSATAEQAGCLGLGSERQHWLGVLEEMPELARGEDGRLWITRGTPLHESHRHFSHLMAIHPLGLDHGEQGPQAQRSIQASLEELDRLGTQLWCGYSFAWLACLAARALDGRRAARALEIFATAFTLRNSFHCNGDQSGAGYSRFTYRPFTLEGNFAAAAGLQEMLLQSHHGIIRVFPAVPEEWEEASFNTLRAEGALLVSARRSRGQVQLVEILAERDAASLVLSPFSGQRVPVQWRAGETIHFTPEAPNGRRVS